MDIQAINNTYILLQRFRFPINNTTRDAIAVTEHNGLILVSLYTLMIKIALSQIWGAIVLLGVALFIRKEHTYNRAAATVGIYNTSASQFSVAKLLITYLQPMKREIWYPILWAVLAVLTMAGATAASILIPKFLIIGHAAPVNPSAVYFPGTLVGGNQVSDTTVGMAFALTVPYFVRSAGQVELTPRNSIVVEQEKSTNPGFVRINYSYNITAADFGLQHAPGLILYVNGSCYTEYGWLVTNSKGQAGDTYYRWNNPQNSTTVSGTNGGPPFALFEGNSDSTDPDLSNTTYSIVVSSIGRPSFSPSTDPWYTTKPSNDSEFGFPHVVQPGRPALSCWETDRFTYNDISSYNGMPISEYNLTDFSLSAFASPDNKTPPFLVDVMQALMPYPIMVAVGSGLGRSSLKSSRSSALGIAFNAGTSSIYQDLEFLVMSSYIATKNMFVETTRFPLAGRDESIPDVSRTPSTNATFNNSAPPRAGTGDFVISDQGIATLSVQALIAIPLAMLAAIGAVALLGLLPTPWKISQALNATMLYSHLHEREEELHNKDAEWNREGKVAFSLKNDFALIHPGYGVLEGKKEKEKEKEKKPRSYWRPKREKPAATSFPTDPDISAAPAAKEVPVHDSETLAKRTMDVNIEEKRD